MFFSENICPDCHHSAELSKHSKKDRQFMPTSTFRAFDSSIWKQHQDVGSDVWDLLIFVSRVIMLGICGAIFGG